MANKQKELYLLVYCTHHSFVVFMLTAFTVDYQNNE